MKTLVILALGGWCWLAQADVAPGHGPAFLYAAEGAKKIIEYGPDGSVAWEYPAEMSRDVWALPGSNVLFCFNRLYDSAKHDNPSGVIEVSRDKKVVFEFATTGQVWSCQRLPDGNTLVGASSQGRLLIVSPAARVLRSIQVRNAPGHSCMRNARQIQNGHFLVAEESARAVREYESDGTFLRETKVSFAPYSAVRLENGHTLVCGQKTIVETDADGRIVWSVEGKDLPELGIRWFAGLQALPNGNLFLCNAGGKVPFLELSRKKEVVWQSPATLAAPIGHGIQRVDVQGPPRK